MWSTSVRDVLFMQGAFFCICECMCVCVKPPSLFCSGVITSRRFCGGVVWPLIEAPSPLSSLFPPAFPSYPFSISLLLFALLLLSSQPTLSSSDPSYQVIPFFTPYLFQPFFSHSRGFPPSSPGRSWSFLAGHRECLGFSRLFFLKLVSPIPNPQRHMQLESVLAIENHKIKYIPHSMLQRSRTSSQAPRVLLSASIAFKFSKLYITSGLLAEWIYRCVIAPILSLPLLSADC